MKSFQWISVILSMLLSLGISRLWSSVIIIFRSRGRAKLDWIPIVWAMLIFVWQLQFWWSIQELPKLISVWTIPYFLVFVTLVILLFMAAVLILPDRELTKGSTLYDEFRYDGRWALAFLSAYFFVALFIDAYFWHISMLSLESLLLILLAIIPLLAIKAAERSMLRLLTLFYIPLTLYTCYILSPHSY